MPSMIIPELGMDLALIYAELLHEFGASFVVEQICLTQATVILFYEDPEDLYPMGGLLVVAIKKYRTIRRQQLCQN